MLGFERLNRVRAVRPAPLADARRGRRHDRATCSASPARAACASRPTRARRSCPRSAATSRATPAGRTPSSTASPAHWVTGIEAVVPPGEIDPLGGPIRKDVAGYDLKCLLVGSEGTLGLVTAAWLRLTPAPELELPVVGFYRDAEAGIAAIERVLGSGVVPAALEYLDGVTLSFAGGAFPFGVPDGAAFMVDQRGRRRRRRGAARRARAARGARRGRARGAHARGAGRGRGALALARRRRVRDHRPARRRLQRGHRRPARPAARGRERDARDRRTPRRDRPLVRHAGDGNIHSTFLFSHDDPDEERRADAACHDLFELAHRLSGTVSGEHGIGWLKRGQLERQSGRSATTCTCGSSRRSTRRTCSTPARSGSRVSATWGLVTATFTASFVEFVEALTIVLAMGLTRELALGARGLGAAIVALAAFTAVAGYALATWLPRVGAPARDRHPAADLRAAVAAQGDPALGRAEGAPRRGRGLPRAGRGGAAASGRAAARPGLVRLRRLVQGRVPRGRRGRLHRHHVRAERGQRAARRRRRRPRPA